jgi:CheY-like chemotaxis protein
MAEADRSARKPTVVLADDHPDVLRSVSQLVSESFDVVGAAADGHGALDAAARADPDLIVLDITMPGLDGLQTALELQRRGSRARVVFLSMHEAADYVAEAFRAGARGYVVKSRLHSDLLSALDHASAGRMFVPSLKSLFVVAGRGRGHAVQFYGNDDALVGEISPFVAMALDSGDAVSVVATDHVRAGVAQQLSAQGRNVGGNGRYLETDAGAALAAIMRDGRPDADRLEEAISQLERTRIETTDGDARMTLVGQIAVPLLERGDTDSALEIERLWNKFTGALPFLSVCCYPAALITSLASSDLFSRVCGEHWAVGHARAAGAMR